MVYVSTVKLRGKCLFYNNENTVVFNLIAFGFIWVAFSTCRIDGCSLSLYTLLDFVGFFHLFSPADPQSQKTGSALEVPIKYVPGLQGAL